MKNNFRGFTLVRHSAWTLHQDPQFERAVEIRQFDSAGMRDAIVRAGGVWVRTYDQADRLESMVNYPENYPAGDTIPCCEGSFVRLKDTQTEVWVL